MGIGSTETLRGRVRRDRVESGQRPGTTTEESAQIEVVKRDIAEPRWANGILGVTASLFAAGFDRPHLHA
jgi:transposase